MRIDTQKIQTVFERNVRIEHLVGTGRLLGERGQGQFSHRNRANPLTEKKKKIEGEILRTWKQQAKETV